MVTMIGDIASWLAAGVVFPLMFLPLAALLGGAPRARATIVWLALVLAVAAAIYLFGRAAVDISPAPVGQWHLFWFGALLALAAPVYLAGGPRAIAARLSTLFSSIATGAGRSVMWLALVMAIVQFAVVILRYVFGLNSIFMQESVTYLHGTLFLAAAGYALVTGDHVRVDIFYREAPAKRKALVDFLGTYFLLFPFCLVTLWAAGPYVATAWSVMEGSTEQSGVQGVFLLKTLIPIFALLLAMAGFAAAANAGSVLRQGKP